MKNLLIALSFAAMPAFGSHFISCDVATEVTGVKNLARLDGSVVFSHGGSIVKADHEQTVMLKVTRILKRDGRTNCLSVGSEVELAVQQHQIGKFKKGDLLKVHYQNVGDRPGSRVSYDIIK